MFCKENVLLWFLLPITKSANEGLYNIASSFRKLVQYGVLYNSHAHEQANATAKKEMFGCLVLNRKGGFYFVPLPKWTPLIRAGSAKKSYEGTRNGSLFNS